MGKIYPFNQQEETKNENKKKALYIKIAILTIIIIIVLLIVAGILIYFLGFYNKNTNDNNQAECQNNFSPHCDECGLTFNQPNAKIIGGIEAVPFSWPSVVYIQQDYSDFIRNGFSWIYVRRSFRCSGVLINRRTVLTTASCFTKSFIHVVRNVSYLINVTTNSYYETIPSMFRVYIAAHNVTSLLNGFTYDPTLQLSVEEIIEHQNYNPVTRENDLAIFKLTYEVDLDNYTQIACLPDEKVSAYPYNFNIESFIAGWGNTTSNGTQAIALNNAKVILYDPQQCTRLAGSNFIDAKIQLCAGDTRINTCQGDTGGGLFIKDKVNGVTKNVLVGLLSTFGCNRTASIFTRVRPYFDWIKQHTHY